MSTTPTNGGSGVDALVETEPGAEAGTVSAPLEPEHASQLQILIVDDDRTIRDSCSTVLGLHGYDVTTCGQGDEALRTVRRGGYDIVLLDLYMSKVSGLDLLHACLEANPDALVIMITGKPSVESSIEALRAGAWDYLAKPFSASQLEVLIGRAAHAAAVARRTHEVQAEFEREYGHSEKVTVLGVSPALREVVDVARKVAPTDASVLLSGESGTGKELIAQFIHHHSTRGAQDMLPVNCAALVDTLLESEMFGHVKGAFTGAIRDKSGLLEAADGSTLFLDEITEMSQALQAKLLRVIQDGAVRRVGGESVDAVVDVRFIAATNRDPREAVADGALREDLYYRLRVVPIRIPPLREHAEDIPILAEHFVRHFWNRHRRDGSPPPRLTEDAVAALQARSWPGNVRELQNVLEHAIVLLEPGEQIQPDQIPFASDDDRPEPRAIGPFAGDDVQKYHAARDRTIGEFERRYFKWLVRRADGNLSKAARIAGIDRTTLYRLMDKHGLKREAVFRRDDARSSA